MMIKKLMSILLVVAMMLGVFTIPISVAAEENEGPSFSTESPLDYEITYNQNFGWLSMGETFRAEVTIINNTEENYSNIWVGLGIFEMTEDGGMSRLQELIAEESDTYESRETGAYFANVVSGQTETIVYEYVIPEEWAGKEIVLLGAVSQTTNDTIITGDFSNYVFEEIIVMEEGYVLTYTTTSPLDVEIFYDKDLNDLSVGDTFDIDVILTNRTENDYSNIWVGLGIFEMIEDDGMSRLQELIAEESDAYESRETGAYFADFVHGQTETLVYECVVPEEWAGKEIVLLGAVSQTTNDTIVTGDFSNYVFEEIYVEEKGFVANDEAVRIFGSTRYETGYKVADTYKETLGVDKFNAVVVATGKNFADALSGSYLAVVKEAPILLTNGNEDNVAALHEYIKANVKEDGMVYILGGEAAIPEAVKKIEGYTVKRLFGNSRYDTNLKILEEAGIEGDELIVATGKNFADSLSASAVKKPILLVKPDATLTAGQRLIVEEMQGGKIYIVGGDGAVSESIENELTAYAEVERVFGQSRYDTSVAVAKKFFESIDTAVLANAKNFPDGLCGGPLAAAMNAPLILTADGKTNAAATYVKEMGVGAGIVLGGTGAIQDGTVENIFGEDSTEKATIKVAAVESAYGTKMWKDICDAFTAETGIKVELTTDKNLEDVIGPSMQGGEYPDIIHLSTGREAALTEQFIKNNMIADITDVFSMTVPGENVKVSAKMAGGFTETALTNPYGDGKTYLAPMFYTPCGLFYNAALLEEKGWNVPTTWDEMWELGDKAKAEGIALFTYPTTGYLDAFFYSLLYSAGGPEFFNAASNYEKGIWATEEATKCFEIVAKLATYIDPITATHANYEDFTLNQQMVLENKAIFMPNGTWIVGEMEFSPRVDGFEWGMMPVPAIDENASQYSYAWIEQAWIPAAAENIDDAKQFLAFLYSDEACAIFAKAGAVQPVKGIADILESDNKMFYSVYDNGAKAAMGNFAVYENVDEIGSILDIFFEPINSLVSGELTMTEWVNNIKMRNDLLRNNLI